jgi:hypothetical protein
VVSDELRARMIKPHNP